MIARAISPPPPTSAPVFYLPPQTQQPCPMCGWCPCCGQRTGTSVLPPLNVCSSAGSFTKMQDPYQPATEGA